MGLYNHTCGITGLSISRGEIVSLVLIADTFDGFCKKTCNNRSSNIFDNFTPILIPIKCIYDGYGGFELYNDCDNLFVFEIMLRYLKKSIVPNIKDKNTINPNKINNLEEIINLLNNDGLFVKSSNYLDDDNFNGHKVSLFPILHSVYEQIIKSKVSIGLEKPVCRNKIEHKVYLDNLSGLNFGLEKLDSEGIPLNINHYERKKYNKKKEEILNSNDSTSQKKIDLEQEVIMINSLNRHKILSDFSYRDFDGIGPEPGIYSIISTLLCFNHFNLNRNEIKKLSESLLDFIMVHYSMVEWRKPWFPVTGIGYDLDNAKSIQKLNNFIKSSINTKNI